ncbi:ribosome assembly cofactor RimP [Formosa sp. PL04]|uniref:ribosome assembly cofactor RimP n=1 Tax=Formosa sp. PL04 TaxID=3081755 RepID=UPI002981D151|nr:ribosome assembly cofactor RimP [Formosa sp. PL04]MDW5287310.1 ribosome assembly cofactor RimP [Formosa sp. PL04]
MFRTTIENLLENALQERNDLFLISLVISEDNTIKVIVDGDEGVSVEDCMFISKAIDHNLDREEQDFSLEVMSAGAASPLLQSRQFIKNIGRTLEVKTQTDTIEAVLVDANEDEIVLEWKAREPKPVGKGKVTVQKKANISYNDIVEAKVMIKF